MEIRVRGNIDIGQSLTEYVEENLTKIVKKYFEKAVDAEVYFSKNKQMFNAVITVNEGVKGGGIVVKADAKAGDVYACFNEAGEKCAKQLRRYKSRIKKYRGKKGIKSSEPNYKALNAVKYILPPVPYNVFEEMENETQQDQSNSAKIVSEKNTDIEELTVDEAIMKMDLQNLPALVFTNVESKRINVVYHRKDGNISWVDPQE